MGNWAALAAPMFRTRRRPLPTSRPVSRPTETPPPVRVRLAGARRGRQGRDEPRPEPQRLRPELRRRSWPDAVPRADVRPRGQARRPDRSRYLRPGRRDPGRGGVPEVERRADDWQRALFRYNPADWYPPLVMGWAERYGYGARVVGRSTGPDQPGFGPTSFALEPRLRRGQVLRALPRRARSRRALGTPVHAIAAGRVTIAGRMSDGAVVVEIEHSRACSPGTATSRRDPRSGLASRSRRATGSARSA